MTARVLEVLAARALWLRATPGAVRAEASRDYARRAALLTPAESQELNEALRAQRRVPRAVY